MRCQKYLQVYVFFLVLCGLLLINQVFREEKQTLQKKCGRGRYVNERELRKKERESERQTDGERETDRQTESERERERPRPTVKPTKKQIEMITTPDQSKHS